MSRIIKVESGFKAKNIVIDLSGVEGEHGVIEAGTPVSRAGVVSNDSEAFGVMQESAIKGLRERVDVIYEAYLDLDECEDMSGLTFSNEALAAMTGLKFSRAGTSLPFVAEGDPAISG